MDLDKLSEHLIRDGVIDAPLSVLRSIGGGCINRCFQVQSSTDLFFLKINSASVYPDMFEREAHGLRLLAGPGAIHVPDVVGVYEVADEAYLLMEYISSGSATEQSWIDFGSGLAALHRESHENFGLVEDNYIGSLVQRNDIREDWPTFFLECRLVPQLEMGIGNRWANQRQFRQAEALCRMMDDEFPREAPALLHGDLWSGNYMMDTDAKPVLVDPAVYYGHREVDLAFSRMFGGFHPDFYEAYNSAWPLADDFTARVDIHNLYPLMVHANLFGGHYVFGVQQVLDKFA